MFKQAAAAAFPDTVYGYANTETRMQSETADNVAWAHYTAPHSGAKSTASASPLSRIEFRELSTPIPLHAVIEEANLLQSTNWSRRTRLLVVTGRSRRLAVENHRLELKDIMDEYKQVGTEVKKTMGDVATAFVVAGCSSGVVVVQAAMNVMDD